MLQVLLAFIVAFCLRSMQPRCVAYFAASYNDYRNDFDQI